MDAKDKAKELVDKFSFYAFTSDYDYAENGAENEYYNAKKCALIAVDLRLEADFNFYSIEYGEDSLEYWELVKTEINKL